MLDNQWFAFDLQAEFKLLKHGEFLQNLDQILQSATSLFPTLRDPFAVGDASIHSTTNVYFSVLL